MLTAYVVIGIILFLFSIYCVLATREIDGADLFIALMIFGIFWPLGFVQMFFMFIVKFLNKLRK